MTDRVENAQRTVEYWQRRKELEQPEPRERTIHALAKASYALMHEEGMQEYLDRQKEVSGE